jgi:hypothetical protein
MAPSVHLTAPFSLTLSSYPKTQILHPNASAPVLTYGMAQPAPSPAKKLSIQMVPSIKCRKGVIVKMVIIGVAL